MLVAYLDGSERDGGIFSVGALAFGVDRAKKATHDWLKLWGNTLCHMNELHVRPKKSAFERWTPLQAGKRLEDSVAILREHASYMVAVSCDMAELRRLCPDRPEGPQSRLVLGGLSTAYALCSHLALMSMGELAREGTDVAYFFESGDDGQAASQKFISAYTQHAEAKRLYRHRSHTVLRKEDCRLFEGADIVAWEWAKHIQRDRDGLHIRPSLEALFGGDLSELETSRPTNWKSAKHRGWHTTGAPLEGFFNRAKEMGLFAG